MKPDLDDPAARHAYRRELRAVAVMPRKIGLMLLVIGLIGLMLPMMNYHDIAGYSPGFLGMIAVGVGGLFLAFAIWVRSRYHQHRMRGGAGR